MSVLIRGMEMPDDCGACPLETDYGTCGYYSLFVEAGHDSEVWKRRDDCPLVEVPPHGRLIDADALMRKKIRSVQSGSGENFTSWTISAVSIENIRNAPTIIEAEEDE